MIVAALRRFVGDRKGNVAIIFAFSLMPIALVTGMGIDYTVATQKKAMLDSAADAAALAAVTPAMMAQPASASITAATTMFNWQAANISGLGGAATPSVTAVDNGLTRAVTVNYTAASKNSFAGVLGQQDWALAGSSQATSSVAPNIDFYLLLDNSPSMAIAATTAGINTMVTNTKTQGGCAFACHESNPTADNLGNPNNEDNYTLAKNLGVVTRIQNLNAATQSLMDTATTTMQNFNSTYRMAIYTFNTGGINTITKLTSSLSTAKSLAAGIDVLEVCQNNQSPKCVNNNDEDTDFEAAMSGINNTNIMPAPGTGMAGSTPEEVLFIVSDGVDDSNVNGSRNQALFSTSMCTTVKNRGIRIAVLYTTYLPLPTNSWYNSYIAPFQPQIAGNMQSCASPGLFFQVSTDQDISAAMAALFQQAVATARLTR
ncbi:MAG TPA: pilus assembly protein TadG-related protein [Xanthobacteraceae bacterium]|jgi:Flp pilus assembly protein TadG|nr:pilus assembly protein TadG-related protein [Xanthobacteraceae bacterium]